MKIELYPPLSISEIGQRKNQEDAVGQWDNHLFVLCDGMGGHENGELASQTVCQSVVKWFEEHVRQEEHFTDDQLRAAIEYAYVGLDKYADGSSRQMGTTLTLLYIHDGGATAAHIGDSRIYHIRPNKGLLYMSRDHSLAFDLFQAGEINYEQMLHYPQKNIVTRAMTPGEDKRMRPDIIHITDVQTGDYFYLCSDGMLEQMDNNTLFRLFSSEATDGEKRRRLIDATARNQDNHSAWIVHIKDVTRGENDAALVNEEPIARCNALNIIPQITEQDEENDVVVIATPPKKLRKKYLWIKIAIAVLAFLVLIAGGWYLFFYNKKDVNDIQIIHKNDSTRHQQPIHAPHRYNATGHIPNR